MDLKCYLCDSPIKGAPFAFKIGVKEEMICAACNTKTINRMNALRDQKERKS